MFDAADTDGGEDQFWRTAAAAELHSASAPAKPPSCPENVERVRNTRFPFGGSSSTMQ